MNIVLLSGGSGKRLWPLSNDVRSKQFIKVFKKKDGGRESMLQKMYRQIKNLDKDISIIIATSKEQVSAIQSQLGESVVISAEPCRRDTFPAIALTAEYLHEVMHISLNDVVVVCPVDPYVTNEYFKALIKLSQQAEEGEANLVLMGIEPTYPSAKYGYIIPLDKSSTSYVKEFKEKPTEEVAKEYIQNGALWNGGVFAFKLGYLIKKAHELIEYIDYSDMLSKYSTLPKISFDYAVVEKEDKIQVQRFKGEWKDLGTWNTLVESIEDKIIGKGVMDDTCTNVHIVNEVNVPVLAVGLHDVIICASLEGILVTDKKSSSYIKPFVDEFEQQVMFAEKSWGSYKVMDVGMSYTTKQLVLKSGHKLSYYNNEKEEKIWIVLEGTGRVFFNGLEKIITNRDVIRMNFGEHYNVFADTELKLVEVHFSANDNKRY